MLARGVRNVIYNYTDAQRKVRSATSNDAWGPPPALMHEIADLTDNPVAYAEIMPSKSSDDVCCCCCCSMYMRQHS
jgi:hypothetical protein